MATPQTVEDKLLQSTRALLDLRCQSVPHKNRADYRYKILEICSSRIGGFDIEWYWGHLGINSIDLDPLNDAAKQLISSIADSGLNPTLTLAALARPELAKPKQKKEGSFYTDFRLAQYCASKLTGDNLTKHTIIDPAAGSGTLLAAAVIKAAGPDQRLAASMIGDRIFACDKDPVAARASSLTLASLTSDIGAIRSLTRHIRTGDSLSEGLEIWQDVCPKGFDVVLTNPPWARLRLTRHQHSLSKGIETHYGEATRIDSDEADLIQQRTGLRNYSSDMRLSFSKQVGTDRDLYALFIELSARLIKSRPGTIVGVFPGGLIRSKGAQLLREELFEKLDCDISVFDNRARLFGIDTRFKFVVLHAHEPNSPNKTTLRIDFPNATSERVEKTSPIRIPVHTLRKLRPDLTVPEVKSQQAWAIFKQLSTHHLKFGDSTSWQHRYFREIDMTKFKPLFCNHAAKHFLPVVEGRMVHQFTAAAKAYVSGSGRKAVWRENFGYNTQTPQFYLPQDNIPTSIQKRVAQSRVGFCDIVGQTNERAVQAAIIPANVVCGNKVPTVQFINDDGSSERDYAFLALANSFVFDWLVRRVTTTTLNFFILDSIPIPELKSGTLPFNHLVELAKDAESMLTHKAFAQYGMKRAEIDAYVAKLYGLTASDLNLILDDFPLLDRNQPRFDDDVGSTITKDLVLSTANSLCLANPRAIEDHTERTKRAMELGALAYIPSEFGPAVSSQAHEKLAQCSITDSA